MKLLQLLLLGLSACIINAEVWEYFENGECIYKAEWIVKAEVVEFIIEAKQPCENWTGIGFVKEKKMEEAEVIFGYDNCTTGEGVIIDGWIHNRYNAPVADPVQNIVGSSIVRDGDYMTMKFTHPRVTPQDVEVNFTASDCYFGIFPVGGGGVKDDGTLEKHTNTPKISDELYCFPETESSVTSEGPLDIIDMTESTMLSETVTPVPPCERKRVCYYSNWSQHRQGKATFVPENIDPTLCDYLIYAYAKISDKYEPIPTETNDVDLYQRFNNLKNEADVKTLLALGGEHMDTTIVKNMLETPKNRKTFIELLVKYLIKYNFDGVSIDFVCLEDKILFTAFVKEMRLAFEDEAKTTGKPMLLMTIAVSAQKEIIDNGYEMNIIQQFVEYIILRAYDLHGPWEHVTGHHTALYPSLNKPNEHKDVNWVATYVVEKGAPKNKLIIGMAMYGRTFNLTDPNQNGLGAPTDGPGAAGECTNEPGMLAYYEICPMFHDSSVTQVLLSEEKVPYLFKEHLWVCYEDITSLTVKVKWLMDNGYAGWMSWMADLDDFKGEHCNQGPYPLISALSKTLLEGCMTGTTLTEILERTTIKTP